MRNFLFSKDFHEIFQKCKNWKCIEEWINQKIQIISWEYYFPEESELQEIT